MKPKNPAVGEVYDEFSTDDWVRYIWTGSTWVKIGATVGSKVSERPLLPTEDELSKHESLRISWENYLITRKLLGI